jgi:hypothetical protein
MFALWTMGRYGDILGQNHRILKKNRQYWEKCVIFLFLPVSYILVNLLMINVTGYHFRCHKHSLCVLLVILGQKPQICHKNM